MILRLGTVEDLSELYMMLLVMHSATVDGTSPVNSEKLTTAINNALHRGVVIVALTLVKSFLEIGRDANIKVKLGHVYSGDVDRKDKFYERLGLVKAGSLYMEA